VPDPTRHHPDLSFPTADLPAEADTRSVGEPNPSGVPSTASQSPHAPVGYELLGEIGRGGMGVVYRARDISLNRDVAVKMLQDRYATNSLSSRRFVDEAKITGQLQHPGIPPVHEVGQLPDGRPFMVMKLIKGRTLAEIIEEGRESRGSLIAVFEQVCQAVAYAHNHSVVHRDLKPSNVMVGAFGEVQVMDWGLAKFQSEQRADSPEATTASTFYDPRAETEAEDDLHTRAGSFLGTPAYMSPEQAIGAVDLIDQRSDVFGLGAVLCSILTGEPPFVAATSESTRQLAAGKVLEPAYTRLGECGAEPALVASCRMCLTGNREERYRNAGEVAAAVHAIRAEVEERARQAELETVRVEGERQKAEIRVEGERQKAEEQQKRRRVQVALAGVVLLVAVGGGIAAVQVERQREQDRIAADQAQADATRQKERETRAAALVDSLGGAETLVVPRITLDLADVKDLARPKLLELASQPVATKPGLHARLALLADELQRAAELAAYLPACRPEELLTIRDALKPQAEAVTPGLWTILSDPKADAGKRVRAAGALAGLAPADARWAAVAGPVAEAVVQANPVEFVAWSAAMEPVRGVLVPKLLARYPAERERIESGKLSTSDLAAAVSGYDLTANLLARYAADRPADLAELALISDPRHYAPFSAALTANRTGVVPILKAELAKPTVPLWAIEGRGFPLSAVAGVPGMGELLDPDSVQLQRGKRKGYAAAALLALGEAESVWPVFRFPTDGDPTVRSYLLSRLSAIGLNPLSLMRRFDTETDVSAQRVLLIALGDFPLDVVPESERATFAGRLLVLYREHPDSGLHSAIDWLLRQKWGKAKDVAAIDAERAAAARARVVARQLADVGSLPVGSLLAAPAVAVGKDWYVNGEGQTYAVVRGPVEFTLGSPATEPGRIEVNEPPHRKRIGRTYAIATKEVTVAEFLRFRPNHSWTKRYSPGPDTPAVSVEWYDAAAYCNWLSEREGIPPEQWSYEPNKSGAYAEGMRMKAGHLKLTGYRLPTEVEWEFACRGGSVTARYFGRGEELLPRYGWFLKNAEDHAWPAGRLRPNERGLFDALGTALEWCEDPGLVYQTGQTEDGENSRFLIVDERSNRLLRGGSFSFRPIDLRSAFRNYVRPGYRSFTYGFRPSRTLPD